MRKKIFIVCLFLLVTAAYPIHAQPQMPYNKAVVQNPNADRDLQMNKVYTQALIVDADQAKAKTMIVADAWVYGPGAKDSMTEAAYVKSWETNYLNQLDRKVNFVSTTWRVVAEHPFKGDWISNWGHYSFTDKQSGKRIDVPWNSVIKIVNGKGSGGHVYFDLLGVMLQTGFTLTPPTK